MVRSFKSRPGLWLISQFRKSVGRRKREIGKVLKSRGYGVRIGKFPELLGRRLR